VEFFFDLSLQAENASIGSSLIVFGALLTGIPVLGGYFIYRCITQHQQRQRDAPGVGIYAGGGAEIAGVPAYGGGGGGGGGGGYGQPPAAVPLAQNVMVVANAPVAYEPPSMAPAYASAPPAYSGVPPAYGGAPPAGEAYEMAVMAAAEAPPQAFSAPMLMVTVPPGVLAGQMMQITTPTGALMQVAVPPGVQPGQQIQVQV
jgi:hypothetical protein